MTMKTIFNLCIFIFFTKTVCFGQPLLNTQHDIDSIRALLKTPISDSARVLSIHLLSRYLTPTDIKEAVNLGEEGLTLAQKINYPYGELKCREALAFLYSLTGVWEKGFKNVFEGIALSKKYAPVDEVYLSIMFCWLYTRLGDEEASLDWAKKSYYHPLFSKSPVDIGQWATLMALGQQYQKLNILDSAYYYTQQSITFSKKYVPKNIGQSLINLIAIYLKQNRYEEAIKTSYESIEEFKKNNFQYSIYQTEDLLAQIYFKINKLDSAQHYAQLALAGSKKINDWLIIRSSAKILADIYEKNNPSKAYSFLKIANSADDTITNLEKIKQINLLLIKEKEKIETQNQIEAKAKEKLRFNTIIGILFTMFIIVILLFYNNQQKKKANHILENTLTDLTTTQQQLEHKNRDLEIEAALDKVRARSLEMQQSGELKEVVATLYDQLRHLGFQYGAACIFIMDKETNDLVQWVSGFNQSEYPIGYYIKYFNHPVWKAQFTAWKNGDKYIELLLANDEKKVFDDYMFTQTDFKNFPEEGKAFMQSLPSVVFSLAFLKHGALQWGPEKLNDEQAKILQKFAVVFEQAYTRFLDLQKAEAQAREAHIETALEKVRSRTMAMQKSEELSEVSYLLNKQVVELGIPTWGCAFNIYNENDSTEWFSSLEITIPAYHTPRENIFLKYYEAGQRGESLLIEEFGGERIKELYKYFATLNDSGDETINNHVANVPDYQINHMAYFKYGYLLFITPEPAPKAHDVFKRFAKVFEQTYTRFLDLQKAEVQAKEAQIETALERVRSHTMAMQKSEDLIEVINVVAEQLLQLNFRLDTASFFLNDESEEFTFWLAAIGESNPNKIIIPKLQHPVLNKIKEAQKKGLDFFADTLTFEEKNAWFQHIFDHSVINRIPEDRKKYLLNTEGYARSVVLMKHIGFFIVNFAPQPYTDEENAIFKRFAKSFEQAYTRFLDLQKAEAQTEQAKLDLIQIQTEKKRAENALIELKATQNQLVQKEKLASLGELTAGIAHEIQNPLNFVNNFSELSVDLVKDLKDEMGKPDIDKEYIGELFDDLSQNQEKINHHGKRASSIVKGMLEHSRASTGVKELTDINKLADEYLRLSYHGLRAKDKDFNADFTTNFDENLPKIEVIPQDIGRVLLNLINNAFYAVNQRKQQFCEGSKPSQSLSAYTPSVFITTQQLDNQIIIKVKDNGMGMSEVTKAKVFQPFFTTKPTGQGTGLGLSLAYDIVTKGHGGTLEVTSTEGVGSEFIITIPSEMQL